MLYVKLENIISEEEAVRDPQRLFNDVENNEDAWVIIRDGKPSFVIASAKLIQNEESGTGLGGFEIGVKPAVAAVNDIAPATAPTPTPPAPEAVPENNSETFYNPFNEPSSNPEPASANVEAPAQNIAMPTPEIAKPLTFETPNLDIPASGMTSMPNPADGVNDTPNSTYTNHAGQNPFGQ